MRIILVYILFFIATSVFGEGSLVYLPPEYRQHNSHSSCVFASITTAMRAAHLWDEADKFWGNTNNRGSADAGDAKRALDRAGIKYKMLYHCDEQGIIDALNSGRMVAVTFGSRHCCTIVGKIDNEAYVVDNNRPTKYRIESWDTFLRMHKMSGGWGVVVLSGSTSKPIIQDNLKGFDK
jgi:hypothetical protein